MVDLISKIRIDNKIVGYVVSINGYTVELSLKNTVETLMQYGSDSFGVKVVNGRYVIFGKKSASINNLPVIDMKIKSDKVKEYIQSKSKTLNMGRDDIRKKLKEVDSLVGKLELSEKVDIYICGSSVFHLNNVDMRNTMDIDYINRLPDQVTKIIQNTEMHYAGGVIGLLEDYTDKLIQIKDGYKNIRVWTLSIADAIVSKLESPKFIDLIDYKMYNLVDLDALELEIASKYAGVSIERVLLNLRVLKNYKGG